MSDPILDESTTSIESADASGADRPITTERRRSTRAPHAARAWLSSQSGRAKGHEEHVMVHDLSLHGVGFVAKTNLHRSAVYWIVIGSGQLHLSSRIRIASCRKRDDGMYTVGAEFF